MSLLLLLNPKQYGGASTDTSDILDRYAKRRRQLEEAQLEEEIAAQLLKARQKDVAIPDAVDPVRLSAILEKKMYENIRADEVHGEARKKRIKMLLMALLMDD